MANLYKQMLLSFNSKRIFSFHQKYKHSSKFMAVYFSDKTKMFITFNDDQKMFHPVVNKFNLAFIFDNSVSFTEQLHQFLI